MVDATTMHKQVLVLRLISKFRTLGMFHADLDPLKRHEPPYIADLDLATYGFTEADLDTEFDVGSFKAGPAADAAARHHRRAARDVLPHVRRRVHVHHRHGDQALRPGAARADPRAADATTPRSSAHILERLTAAETLERYLHTKYVGQKRFSRRGRRHDDPDARPPDPARRRARRAARR